MRTRPAPLEQDFVAWAEPLLSGVQVGTRLPASLPAKFLRVIRGAGTRRNVAQSGPSLVIEAWGATDADAWALASDVWALLTDPQLDRIGSTWLSDVDVSEPVNFPDAESRRPRYVFTFFPVVVLPQESS